MATSNHDGDIQEQTIKCLHCKTKFDEGDNMPRVLPCLHLMCSSCLKKLLKNNTQVQCPQCGSTTETIDIILDDLFPVDYAKLDLLSFSKSFSRNIKVDCNMCDNKKPALKWCRDCETFLCDTCTVIHMNLKILKIHVLADINQIQRPLDFSLRIFCTKEGHSNMPMNIYCAGQKCRKTVCATCWIEDHSNHLEHTKRDLHEQFEEEKKLIHHKASKTNEKQVNIGKLKQRINEEIVNVSKQAINAEFEITTAFNNYIRLLEARKTSLLETLNNVTRQKQTILKNQTSELEKHKRKMSDAQEFLRQSCLSQNPAAFLALVPVMNKRFEELNSNTYDQSPQVVSDVAFSNRNIGTKHMTGEEFEEALTKHGELLSSTAFPPNTCVLSTKPNIQGDGMWIEISLKDYNGDTIEDRSVILSAIATETSSGAITRLNFRKLGNGSFISTKKLHDNLKYQFRLLVNGEYFKDVENTECMETSTVGITEEELNTYELNDLYGTGQDYADPVNELDLSIGNLNGRHKDFGIDEATVSIQSQECCSVTLQGFSESTTQVVLEDRNEFTVPSSITITQLDKNKVFFLVNSLPSRGVIDKLLEKFSAKVEWSSVAPNGDSLTILCTLSTEQEYFIKRAAEWVEQVTRELSTVFEILESREEQIEKEEWDYLKAKIENIPILDNTRVIIKPNKENLKVIVVGYKSQFMEAFCQVKVLTEVVTVHESLDIYQLDLLTNGDVLSEIANKHKTVKINPNKTKKVLEFSGKAAIVDLARQEISNVLKKVVSKRIARLSLEKMKFIQIKAVQVELAKQLKLKNIVGSWKIIDDNSIDVYAMSVTLADNAAEVVKASLFEINIDINMQQNRQKLETEIAEIKLKMCDRVDITIPTENRVFVLAIPKSTAQVVAEHLRMYATYPGRSMAYFITATGQMVIIVSGDVIDLESDVLLCSSDRNLNLGIGVGLDLVTKGGQEIQKRCQNYLATKPLQKLDEGEVFCSTAGQLKIKMVVHIPGKEWENKPEVEKAPFIKMVQSSFDEADKNKCTSISIPALCCGNNKYPVKQSTQWIVEAINLYMTKCGNQTSINKIYLCDKNEQAVTAFNNASKDIFDLVYSKS